VIYSGNVARPAFKKDNESVLAQRPAMEGAHRGYLVINGDDWGRDEVTTNSILTCLRLGSVSCASGMVFMKDSERAAGLAREHGVDTGLHLNFTAPFSAGMVPGKLSEQQGRLARFLSRSKLMSTVYHPGLVNCFQYVVATQLDEFRRLYGSEAARIDGHHHMHLCANVVFSELLPHGAIVRRNFSFAVGEKSALNRWYRRVIDRKLARHHRMADYFFSLPPIQESRLSRMTHLAKTSIVEVETHPARQEEFDLLTGRGLRSLTNDIPIATEYPSIPFRGKLDEA
jgi:predicted glycoside hydrolase/deacetylase ChbG (UPF0249 family)